MINTIAQTSQTLGLFDEGTPTTWPTHLDGSTIPAGMTRRVPTGDGRWPIPLPFFLQKPPGSAATLAAWLDAKCDEFSRERGRPVYGVYPSIATMAEQTGFSERTISATALRWMIRNGWIERQDFRSAGTIRTMWWCKWRFPVAPAGAFAAPISAPERARYSALQGARYSAPKQKSELNSIQKTTTDAELLSFVQVQDQGIADQEPEAPPAEPSHSRPIDVPITVPSVPMPAEIPEPVAQAIEAVEVVEDRPALRAFAPALLAHHPVELVILVILAFRQKRLKGGTVSDLRAWSEGVIKNGPGGSLVKAEAKRIADQARKAREAESNRSYAEASRAKLANDAAETQARQARKLRWHALSDPEKQGLRSEYERQEPRPAARALWKLWEQGREDWCANQLAERQASR